MIAAKIFEANVEYEQKMKEWYLHEKRNKKQLSKRNKKRNKKQLSRTESWKIPSYLENSIKFIK